MQANAKKSRFSANGSDLLRGEVRTKLRTATSSSVGLRNSRGVRWGLIPWSLSFRNRTMDVGGAPNP